jgi:CRISPR-associated protein Csm2
MPQNVSAQGRGRHSGRLPQNPSRHDARQSSTIDTSKIVFGAKIDPKLYSDIAEEAARSVGSGSSREQNKPSQLRRFYDELVMLQGKVGSNGERFEQHQPFIQMLKAKVAYAEGRKKVDNKFATLLRRVVDQATDAATLKQARLFMEAFMAFYKAHGPTE